MTLTQLTAKAERQCNTFWYCRNCSFRFGCSRRNYEFPIHYSPQTKHNLTSKIESPSEVNTLTFVSLQSDKTEDTYNQRIDLQVTEEDFRQWTGRTGLEEEQDEEYRGI